MISLLKFFLSSSAPYERFSFLFQFVYTFQTWKWKNYLEFWGEWQLIYSRKAWQFFNTNEFKALKSTLSQLFIFKKKLNISKNAVISTHPRMEYLKDDLDV